MFGSRSGMMAERVLPSVFGGGELRDLVWMSLFAILIWKNMQSSMIPSYFYIIYIMRHITPLQVRLASAKAPTLAIR